MGRTNPTYRNQLETLEGEWNGYRRALRASEQPHFDRLFEHGREYAHAASYLNHTRTDLPLLIAALLAHERRLASLEAQLDSGGDSSHAVQD